MQLTETVTIINKSGKIISNGKHIANIFKEAKAAYQDKKAAIKAERAAAADPRPAPLEAQQTFDFTSRTGGSEYDHDHIYHVPDRRHFLVYEQGFPYERPIEDDGRRRSVDDATSYVTSTSRRSHGSHRSRRSHSRHVSKSRPPLTETNLRTLSELSSTTPSQPPMAYRSPYAEIAPGDNMMLSRPTLVHAPTEPTMGPGLSHPQQQSGGAVSRTVSDSDLRSVRKKKKDIDMNLAYGDIPPDLAERTDLGPATAKEEKEEKDEGGQEEQEARNLLTRIEALLDEAECVQYTATSIIDHLQRTPEAAAAVALLLAELSTLLKAISPSFLAVVKGGFPAIFALLASPQFLVGVGVAVGVTVVCFGGWKIVKRIKAAKATAAEKEANAQSFEMEKPPAPPPPPKDGQTGLQAGAAFGADGSGSVDDALVLEEELSTIETWRRGIPPHSEDGESVDLELITPEAARSVRDDGRSIRTSRTHRSSKSHRSHRSRRHHDQHEQEEEEEGVHVPARKSSKSHAGGSKAPDAKSEVDSERSHGSSRSKKAARKEVKAIENGSVRDDDSLEAALRPKDRKPSMLKTLFKRKKEKEDGRELAVSVMA